MKETKPTTQEIISALSVGLALIRNDTIPIKSGTLMALVIWLRHHESDIANDINDYGELKDIADDLTRAVWENRDA